MEVKKILKNPKLFLCYLDRKGIIQLNEKTYLKIIYKAKVGRKLHLDNPKTFNEKLQWVKLYDRKKIYTTMVDKYAVKDYIANIIGDEYIIPTLGIYDKFDDIDFKKLPEQFVIKCTHDSGGVIVCRNKKELNIEETRKTIEKLLAANYYNKYKEWPYKNVKSKIMIEKYMGENLSDYKVQCFNGIPDHILVCVGRDSVYGVKFYYFSPDWKFINYCPYDDLNFNPCIIKKPNNLDKMLEFSKLISKNALEMRVDFYNIDDKLYFGEITLFSDAGFDTDITYEADKILGSKLKLPNAAQTRSADK